MISALAWRATRHSLLVGVVRLIHAPGIKFSLAYLGWIGLLVFWRVDYWFSLWQSRNADIWTLGFVAFLLLMATVLYVACGCAGIFNAPFALESYAKVFEEEGALDRLQAFAAEHGARFYGLPLNAAKVALERAPTLVPATLPAASTRIVPFHAGETLAWRFLGRVH